MRLGRVTMIETTCFFNWSKNAWTFITGELRRRGSTRLTCISGWQMLKLKQLILFLPLGNLRCSHG